MSENMSRIYPKALDKSLAWTPSQSARAINRYNWAVRSDRFTNSLSPYYRKTRDKSRVPRNILGFAWWLNWFSSFVIGYNLNKEFMIIDSHGLCDVPLSILGHCRFWVMLFNFLAMLSIFVVLVRVDR
jgi:hypothetical protein